MPPSPPVQYALLTSTAFSVNGPPLEFSVISTLGTNRSLGFGLKEGV